MQQAVLHEMSQFSLLAAWLQLALISLKLRNVALGILSPSSFTNAEIQDLENNLSRQQGQQ